MPLALPEAMLGAYSVEDGRSLLPRLDAYELGDVSRIKGIAIHHTATHPLTEPEVIARYHVQVNHWPAIGYHVLAYETGRVVWCLDLEEWGAHVYGRNHEWWGVALVGNFQERAPTQYHLATAYRVVAELQTIMGDFLPVQGHRELALPGHGTACPGATYGAWLDLLQRHSVAQDALWDLHPE